MPSLPLRHLIFAIVVWLAVVVSFGWALWQLTTRTGTEHFFK
jgi:hypothetical protein